MAAPAGIEELRHRYAAQPRRYLAPLASALRQSGALEEAVTMLRAQLAEYPEHLTGHVVLGQALFDTGALAESRAAFERARALDPGNRVVLRHLGEIASLAGDAAGARVWFGRLRAAEPYADDIAAQLGGASGPPVYDPAEDEAPVAVEAGHEVAEPVPVESFELLEFDPAPDLDPVVGLDLPPEAPPAELQAESNDSAAEAGALEHVAAGPFATETMAGLLAAQGHTEQAIAIYERLAAQRPEDEALRARLVALRAAPEETRPADGTADDAARGRVLAAAFADLPRRPESAPGPAGAAAPIASSPPGPAGAADPLAADPLVNDPFADVSFDRFFDQAADEPAGAPTPGPEAGGDADLARFDAWLRRGAA